MGKYNNMQFARITTNNLDALGNGDIVRVRRICYWHYGVFCKAGTVIHLTSYPDHIWSTGVKVKETDLRDFAKSSEHIEVLCRVCTTLDTTADKARARIGESGYSLLKRNCKHFAFSCAGL